MKKFIQQKNTGVSFLNADGRCDYCGTVNVEGGEFQILTRIKTGKEGEYLTHVLKPRGIIHEAGMAQALEIFDNQESSDE